MKSSRGRRRRSHERIISLARGVRGLRAVTLFLLTHHARSRSRTHGGRSSIGSVRRGRGQGLILDAPRTTAPLRHRAHPSHHLAFHFAHPRPSWPLRRAVGRCHGGDTALRNAALGCARPTGPSATAAGRCSFFVHLRREAARDGRGGGTRRLLARCRGLPCPSGPSAAGRCWCRAPGWAGARDRPSSPSSLRRGRMWRGDSSLSVAGPIPIVARHGIDEPSPRSSSRCVALRTSQSGSPSSRRSSSS